jgi:hypothetical protein
MRVAQPKVARRRAKCMPGRRKPAVERPLAITPYTSSSLPHYTPPPMLARAAVVQTIGGCLGVYRPGSDIVKEIGGVRTSRVVALHTAARHRTPPVYAEDMHRLDARHCVPPRWTSR